MAALDFPDSPTVGQVFDKWTWNGTMWVLTPGTGAGYVYVQDTAPTPRKVGDTWFDTSTGATGGTSWVAIEEGAVGSEKVWVQTSPGAGLANGPRGWVASFTNNITAVTTGTAETSILQGTAPLVSGRRYNAVFGFHFLQSVATDTFFVRAYVGGTQQWLTIPETRGGNQIVHGTSQVLAYSGGGQGCSLTMQRVSGTGTGTSDWNYVIPQFDVYDVGAV